MKIAVLALQGAFEEHIKMLARLDAEGVEIRQRRDLTDDFDGIIIPGGESTVMGRLLRELRLFDPVNELIRSGVPCWGTCAGLILLAQEIANDDNVYFGAMPVRVKRNAYGRQLGSFSQTAAFGETQIKQVFIRAPYIEKILDGECRPLSVCGGNITAAEYKNLLATAFHPELTDDLTVHRYFLDMVMRSKN